MTIRRITMNITETKEPCCGTDCCSPSTPKGGK
jgi:hypothetical protein